MCQEILILKVEIIYILVHLRGLRIAGLKLKEWNKRMLSLAVFIDTHPKIMSVFIKPLNLN